MRGEELLSFIIDVGAYGSSSSYFGKKRMRGYMTIFDCTELVHIAATCLKVCRTVMASCQLAFVRRGISFSLLPLISVSDTASIYQHYLDLPALRLLQTAQKSMQRLHHLKQDRIERGFKRISCMHNTLNETLVLTDHGRNVRVILRDFENIARVCLYEQKQEEKNLIERLCALLHDMVVSQPQSFHFGTWRASLRSASHWTRLESLAYNSFNEAQKAYLLSKLSLTRSTDRKKNNIS